MLWEHTRLGFGAYGWSIWGDKTEEPLSLSGRDAQSCQADRKAILRDDFAARSHRHGVKWAYAST